MSELEQEPRLPELFCYESLLLIYQLSLGIVLFNVAWLFIKPIVKSAIYYDSGQVFSVRFGLVILTLLIVVFVVVTLPFVVRNKNGLDIEGYIQTTFEHPLKYTVGLCLGVLFGLVWVIYVIFSLSSPEVASAFLFGVFVSSVLAKGFLQKRTVASSTVASFGGTSCVGLGAVTLTYFPYGVLFVALGTFLLIASRVMLRRSELGVRLGKTAGLILLVLLFSAVVVGAAETGVPIGAETVEISCINVGDDTVSNYSEVDNRIKQRLPPATEDELQQKDNFNSVRYERLTSNEGRIFKRAMRDSDYTHEGVQTQVRDTDIYGQSDKVPRHYVLLH